MIHERWRLPLGGGIEVRDCSGGGHLERLRQFLTPHLGPPGSTDAITVTVTLHPAGWSPPPSVAAGWFSPEGERPGAYSAPTRVTSEGAVVLVDPRIGTTTMIADNGRRIDIGPDVDANDDLVCQSTYAAVREVIATSVAAEGGYVLHAASITLPGAGGIAIVGSKGAGKTTLTAALLELGAGYLASDRTFVVHGRLIGWIATFRISLGSADLLGPLTATAVRRWSAANSSAPYCYNGGKYRLPPSVVLDPIGARGHGSARHAATVMLEHPVAGSLQVELASRDLAEHVVPYRPLLEGPGPLTSLRRGNEGADPPTLVVRGRAEPRHMARTIWLAAGGRRP